MSFTSLVAYTPGPVLFLLLVGVPVVITLILVGIYNDRLRKYMLRQADLNETEGPDPGRLSDSLVRILSFAFVFFLGLAISNFWGNTKDARSATEDESQYMSTAYFLASNLPGGESRDAMTKAIEDYANNVRNVEYPLMHEANEPAAVEAHAKAGFTLSEVVLKTQATDAGQAPEWNDLESAISDMLSSGTDRVAAIPGQASWAVLAMVSLISLANILVVGIMQVTRKKFTMALLGAFVFGNALLIYVAVQLSNPYWGLAAITPPQVQLL